MALPLDIATAPMEARPAAALPRGKPALTSRLEGLVEPPGFTGRAPGGPSRWSTERSGEWRPLRPELVVEVRYDQVTGGRFRHGTTLLRWRPDKAPRQCGFDQLPASGDGALALLEDGSRYPAISAKRRTKASGPKRRIASAEIRARS